MTMPPEPPGPPGPPTPPPGPPTPPPGDGGFPAGGSVPGGQPAGVARPGELQNRFLARLIDHILIGVVMGVSYGVLSAIFLGFSNSFGELFIFWTLEAIIVAVIALGYFAVLESNRGQTVGKMVMKLQTYGPDGVSHPTMEQAVKRNIYAGLYILGIIPFIGWFLLYWAAPLALAIFMGVTLNKDPNKQGWHDKFAGGTQVKQIG